MDAFYQYAIKRLILLTVTLLIRFLAGKAVGRFLSKFEGDIKRKRVSIRIINLFLSIFFILIFAAIWNIETKDLIVFFTSTITVIGIAFFANWSILSNITASLILYFNHPLNIGETLRIYDKEFDIEGELIDLSFFFMYIKSSEGFLITIPTSAVLNKTVIIKSQKNAHRG